MPPRIKYSLKKRIGLVSAVLKQGAILYNKAEVFSPSVTNLNGLPMLPFDWSFRSNFTALHVAIKFWRTTTVIFCFILQLVRNAF